MSSKLWSLQLWTQFKQLQIEAWKSWLERCTSITRSRVQTPLKSWLFQASPRNCLNCVHNCDNHSLLDFQFHSSIYEIFHISLHNVLLSCKLKWLTLKNSCTTDWWRSQLLSKQPTINNKKSLLTKDRDCLICHWVTAVVFEMASREQLEQCLVLVLDGFCCFLKGRAVFLNYLNNHFTYFGYVVDLKSESNYVVWELQLKAR